MAKRVERITLLVGLPGSGKTTLAHKMLDQNSQIIDDLSVNPFYETTSPHLIICDPMLCFVEPDAARTKLIEWFGTHNIAMISFVNDLDVCWERVTWRDDGRVIGRSFMELCNRNYGEKSWRKNYPILK